MIELLLADRLTFNDWTVACWSVIFQWNWKMIDAGRLAMAQLTRSCWFSAAEYWPLLSYARKLETVPLLHPPRMHLARWLYPCASHSHWRCDLQTATLNWNPYHFKTRRVVRQDSSRKNVLCYGSGNLSDVYLLPRLLHPTRRTVLVLGTMNYRVEVL